MENAFNKDIKIFILKFLVISFLILILDRGIARIMHHYYFRQKSGVGYLTTYSIDSTRADILVFGSSRANHSYVPEIFEKRLGSSFYNTGRDGTYIIHNYAVFKSIILRYIPKMVIFDIRPEDVGYSVKEYDMLSLLLPYCETNPAIREIVDFKSPMEKIKRVSELYTYNSLVFQIAAGNLESNRERVPALKGYVPLFRKMDKSFIDTAATVRVHIDEFKLKLLGDLVQTCRERNIRLIFVNSPTWRINRAGGFEKVWNAFCSENSVNYLDISNMKDFIDHPEFFSDVYHLNDTGARQFSEFLVNELQKMNTLLPEISNSTLR
jgi:hypothetical protein